VTHNAETLLSYLHGRIDREIETLTINSGIPYSWFAARLSELLSPTRTRLNDSMPGVQPAPPFPNTTVEPLALGNGSSGRKTPATKSTRSVKHTEIWHKMTPEQRSAEAHRRRLKAAKNKGMTLQQYNTHITIRRKASAK
jgi:hypothetical protein